MNKLLFLFLFSITFLLIRGNALAYDLRVSCGESFCSLSSYSPIFSAEIKWTPGKIESREIQIKNTEAFSKEIFIRARDHNSSTKELDSHMNITLFDGSAKVWQGKLSDFIEAEKIKVKNIAGGEESTLGIEAQMNLGIPNDMQGKSSVFNFGFGFEGESEGNGNDDNDDENENNNGDNSSNTNNSNSSGNTTSASGGSGNSTNIPAAVSTQSPNLLATVFNRVSDVFEDVENEAEAATVAGERTNTEKEKEVLGAGDSMCRENYLWILFLITQALYAPLLFLKRFEKRLKLLLIGHSVLFAVSVTAVYLLSCILWPILISAAIFITPIGFLLFKKYRSRLS